MNDETEKIDVFKDVKEELRAQLTFRQIEVPSDIIMDSEIKRAVGEINRRRRFTPTETKLYDDKYESLIVPMVIFSLSKVGIEGETSHSENGIQRIYAGDADYPQDLLNTIVPLAK